MSAAPLNRYRCVMLRRSGASEIRVIRAESEAAARAQLAAMGREPVSVEPIGPSLFDSLYERVTAGGRRVPRLQWRPSLRIPPRDIWWPALLILATIPFTTAIGAWTLTGIERWRTARLAERERPAIARAIRAIMAEEARRSTQSVMAAPALSSIVARLRGALPDEAGLAAIAISDDGALTIDIETPDPDRLRGALAADPLLGALREFGQSRTGGGTIRVSLKGRIA